MRQHGVYDRRVAAIAEKRPADVLVGRQGAQRPTGLPNDLRGRVAVFVLIHDGDDEIQTV